MQNILRSHFQLHPPKDNIVFNFYDSNLAIISAINNFYNIRSEWIPSNIKLNLYWSNKARQELQLLNDVQGRGCIDSNYINTTKQLVMLINSEE